MSQYLRHLSVAAAAILASSLLLSGCGGGGGDTTTTAYSATLSGKAVDELILNGVVKVHEGSAAGPVIGSGRTDSQNGTYTINVGDFRGVAVVSVTCDASSTLFFPDTNSTEACPTETQLYSAASVKENGNITVNVAPSTHIMYMMATGGDANSTIDDQQLEEARVAVAQIFGTDPIKSDPTEGIYADVIEAFHAAAEEADVTIQEFVEEIANDAADGELGDDSNVTKILAQNMQENNVTTSFVEAAENNQTFTPEVPDDAATIDDVQAAKEFFESLRTQGDNLFETGGLFDSEAQSMQSLVENVTLNGDLAGIVIGNLLDAVGYAIYNNLTDYNRTLVTLDNGDTRVANLSRANVNEKTWSYTITDTVNGTSKSSGSGTIALPAANPADDIDPSAFSTLSAAFDGTIPATKLFEQTQNLQTFKANATMTKTTDGAHLEVSDITLSTDDGTMIGIKGFKADAGYDFNASNQNNPLTLNYVKLNEITLNGALDQNYTGTGTLKVGYTMNDSLAANGFLKEAYVTTIEGEIGCLDVNNSRDGKYADSNFTIVLGNKTYNIPTDENGWFRTTIDGQYYYDDIINADKTFDQNSCQTGATLPPDRFNSYVENDTKVGNSGYIPNTMTLNGNLKNVQTGTEYQGMVGVQLLNAADINVSSEDDPHVKVTLSGTLKRAGLDEMSLNLQAENNPDTNISTGSLAYVYGATTVNVQSTVNDEGDGNITITSGNGLAITIVLDNGDIDYNATTPLTKDGRIVGNLDNSTGIDRIKYIDGSFESLY